MVKRLAVIACLTAFTTACTTFEREDVVLDLRILAIAAEPPDQVIDVDLEHPPDPIDLLDQLAPTTVCALVADPDLERKLRYELTLCVLDNDLRCSSEPRVALGQDVIDNPDSTIPGSRICATIAPDGNLAGILLDALEGDVLHGLGGVDYGVELRVGLEFEDPASDQFAGKTLRVSPRIPAERTPNANPSVLGLDISDGEGFITPPGRRCIDYFDAEFPPFEVTAGDSVKITPVEPDGGRESYTVPTLDGGQQTFTESWTYHWFAAAGSFSAASTGGPRDLLGNPPVLHSDYRAPTARQLGGFVTDIPIWIVQRDERLGVRWYEDCIRVRP